MSRIVVEVPDDLHWEFKAECARQGQQMSQVLRAFIVDLTRCAGPRPGVPECGRPDGHPWHMWAGGECFGAGGLRGTEVGASPELVDPVVAAAHEAFPLDVDPSPAPGGPGDPDAPPWEWIPDTYAPGHHTPMGSGSQLTDPQQAGYGDWQDSYGEEQ